MSYFFASYRYRLRDAVRRLDGPIRQIALLLDLADRAGGDACTVAELPADLAALSPADRALLVWRVEEGERFTEIAERLGVNGRTVHRRWSRLQSEVQPLVNCWL